MARVVELFMRPHLQASFTRKVGRLPRGVRFARHLEKSHVVIDAFEEADRNLVARALEAALPTALVTEDRCAASTNIIVSAITQSVSRRGRLALMVAPAQAALRMVAARLSDAEGKLIAHAAVHGDEIRVLSCEPRLYQCSVHDIGALARIPPSQRGVFEISSSGSRIHWPAADVDLALDDFREVCDEEFAQRQRERVAEDLARYGAAIRSLRNAHGLRQSDIDGLSEREVRRIEQGRHSPHVATLKKLAAAHQMPLKTYLDELAERS